MTLMGVWWGCGMSSAVGWRFAGMVVVSVWWGWWHLMGVVSAMAMTRLGGWLRFGLRGGPVVMVGMI